VITIRLATPADLPALGRLGALLMRTHYEFDPQRFMSAGTDAAEGYAWFLGRQLKDEDVVIYVAEQESQIVGYVYAGLEPMSWKELREPAGFVHDVATDPSVRRQGVASALMAAAIDWLRQQGAPRVVLWSAEANTEAQRLFASLGFRRTMVEMTKELDGVRS